MIKKLLNPGDYPQNINTVLLLLRITVGVFMLTHGTGKSMKLIGSEPVSFPDPIGVGATASLALTVFAEVFCSIFLIFGIATRLVVIPLMITMLVAALVIHATDGFGKQELPLLYAVLCLILVLSGAGKFSVDHLLYKKYMDGKDPSQI